MSVETRMRAALDLDRQIVHRLMVSWRRPDDARYFAVGWLDELTDDTYRFTYRKDVATLDGFRPLVGFSDVHKEYASSRLFALFSQRVMDPARPDRPQWLTDLGLAGDAGPMEILARSGGRRQGDRIELTPMPRLDRITRLTSAQFLVHGIRHHPGAGERVAALRPGDALAIVERPDNQFNPRALLVSADRKQALGWVPDPLLDYVHDVLRGGKTSLAVVTANGLKVDPHLQLVVRFEGLLPSDAAPFGDSDWSTAA